MPKKEETNELDDILQSLKVTDEDVQLQKVEEKQEIVVSKEKPPKEKYTEEKEDNELQETIKGLNELIDTNAEILEEARRLVETTGDVEYLEAYSSIGKSQSEAFKNKIKLLLEKEKNRVFKQTKNREIDVKEKQVDHTIGVSQESSNNPKNLSQTNIILSGSREEMFNLISDMAKEEKEKKELEEKEAIDV